MSALQPIPAYLPSNYTADEMLRVLEDSLPAYLYSTITDRLQELRWEVEVAEERAATEEAAAAAALKDAEGFESERDEAWTLLRDMGGHWDAVLELITKTRRKNAAVEMMEEYIAKAHEVQA